ncbi:DsbA family protein [Streptomyces sp. NPDC004111]|uniref:DsbA family protein n=1 Tax=Streptomyces sp. NPDC004111 TaxID=3364690 RepID=UPI0036C0DE7E
MKAKTVRRAGRGASAALAVLLLGVAGVACSSADAADDGKGGASASASGSAGTDGPAAHRSADAELLAGLPSAMADDGVRIVVGRADAPHTVAVAVDPQCGWCAKFEANGGKALAQAVKDGRVKAEYTVASFLDRGETGGSTRAANAMRASVESGRFAEFHAAVFASQAPEHGSGFTVEHLLRIADQVDCLRGAAFDRAVKELGHHEWVAKSMKAFTASGDTAVPSVRIDGEKVTDTDALLSADGFAKELRAHGVR